MNKYTVIEELNKALVREVQHWAFYTQASIYLTGAHREEYKEFFEKEAEGESQHIRQFGNLIVGIGGIPTSQFNISYPLDNDHMPYSDINFLINYACLLEAEVVENYIKIMDMAAELEENGGQDKIHGRYIQVFLEDQLMDSQQAIDHLNQIKKGF